MEPKRKRRRGAIAEMPARRQAQEPLAGMNRDELNRRLYEKLDSCSFFPPEIRKLILDGADPGLKNSRGMAPLMFFGRLGLVEDVKWLVGMGADVNGRDNSGQTVLMHVAKYASTEGHLEILRLLVEKGADKGAKWGDITARNLAWNYAYDDAVKLLDSL